MKRVCVCLLLLALVLSGCSIEIVKDPSPAGTGALVISPLPGEQEDPAETTASPETTCQETEAPVLGPPAPAPTQPPETEPPETKPQETVGVSSALPYLLRIDRADQSIFDGPGYDYAFVDTVRQRGTYTIVEEVRDHEGNLWGRLKSGIGWVDLTQIRSDAYAESLISANFADDNLLLHADYHHCVSGEAEYRIPIAIRAYGKLRDVAVFSFAFYGDEYTPGPDIFTLPELDEDMPLVAELAFPGDMSMYGIRFTDEKGNNYIYSIYISGRNGALVLEKYQ